MTGVVFWTFAWACLGFSAAAASAATLDATAGAGDFYHVPANIGAYELGALVKWEQVNDLSPLLHGALGYRVMYRSGDGDGGAIGVTGMVYAPRGEAPRGGWPIVVWAHGTVGVGDRCAPSKFDALYYGEYALLVGKLVRGGFVVVATDYEGLGTPGLAKYLELDSAGRSIIDAVPATRALVPTTRRQWAVIGHSQGGHAALGAAEVAGTRVLPELTFVGAVALAPASHLAYAPPSLSQSPSNFDVLTDMAAGIRASDPSFDYSGFLGPTLLPWMPKAEVTCSTPLSAFFSHFPTTGVLATNWYRNRAVQAYLTRNEPGQRRAAAPILVLQGAADRTVPILATNLLVKSLRSIGDHVDYEVFPHANHDRVVFVGFPDALAWLYARFDERARSE
jgi:alpha-beta hydrolase superfamily lysophospholipase